MHPNAFLRAFWRADVRPEVFVAMSFHDVYRRRFEEVIQPAIEANSYAGQNLRAKRVDLSKTGDSILTDINDGIAHAVMVLADVSTIGRDSKDGSPYRSGNVMYEVGLALACRHSSEVLLVRDDQDRFLFDVSTVPHMHLDFTDRTKALMALAGELGARLSEITHVHDARVAVAVATLTSQERQFVAKLPANDGVLLFKREGISGVVGRLLDKQLIRPVATTLEGMNVYMWTPLGKALATTLDQRLPRSRGGNEQSVELAGTSPPSASDESVVSRQIAIRKSSAEESSDDR